MCSMSSIERPRQRPGITDGAYVRSLRTKDDVPICAQNHKLRHRRGSAQPAQQNGPLTSRRARRAPKELRKGAQGMPK